MKKKTVAVLLALPAVATGSAAVCGGDICAADALAAYDIREGVNGSDAIVDWDGECPLVIENETLTLHIRDLPATQEEAQKSESSVTAEYTLYNPTNEDVTLTLFYPVGYQSMNASPQTAECSVTVDGRVLDGGTGEIERRYTYYERGYYGFGADPGEALPRSERNTETFYQPSTPVTRYAYTVEVPSDGKGRRSFTFSYDANPRRTQVFSAENGASGVNNGWGEIYRSVDEGRTQEIVIYAIGETPKAVKAGIYSMSGSNALPVAETGAPEVSTMTFDGLVQAMYAETDGAESAMSYLDFYNATVCMLTGESADMKLTAGLNGDAVLENLMLWYEYELYVPAQGRVVNTVSAPLRPDLSAADDGRWGFGYLLSPGQRWAEVERFEINIETQFYLESSSLRFLPREGGYTYTKDGLPQGELSVVIARAERETIDTQPYDDETPTLTTALILLGVALGAAVIAVVTVICVRLHAKKKQRAEQERLSRGRAEEGKVDLDPFPEAAERKEDGAAGNDDDHPADDPDHTNGAQ